MKKIIFLTILSLFFSCKQKKQKILSYKEVFRYLQVHKRLPSYYIKKGDAKRRGWNPRKGNLWQVLPGRVIGGDRFGNREKRLPRNRCGSHTRWTEADYDYRGGRRGAKRLVFCFTKGRKKLYLYKTENHYRTFQEVQ